MLVEATPPHRSTRVIHTGPPHDGEQPSSSGAVGPVPVDRSDRALVGLLREIVGVLGVAEVTAQPPDVPLGLTDETFQGTAVAIACGDQQIRQVVHPISVAELDEKRTVTNVKSSVGFAGNSTLSVNDLTRHAVF